MKIGDLGLHPVSKDKPQGDNVRDEDIFFELKEEIGKLSSPSARENFSWETVEKTAATILKDHSKDLMAASYLGGALVNLKKGDGLDNATEMYWNLVNRYWDSLYPEKAKGRMAALSWWLERTRQALTEPSFSLTFKQAKAVSSRLNDLAGFLGNRMENPPSFGELIRQVKTLASSGDKQTKEPASGTKQAASDSGGAGFDLTPDMIDVSGESPEEAIKNLLPLFQKIKQTAKLLRDDKIHSPQAYTWLRFSVWESVRSLPPASDNVTRISPPAVQTMNHLEKLLRDEDYAALVQASESALASSRNLFVIELNYYSWTALDKLGKKYHGARDTVFFETRTFMNRLSGLKDLRFSDNSPFVSDQAAEWLEKQEERLKGRAAVSGARSVQQDQLNLTINTVRERLSKDGMLTEAVQALQQSLDACTSKKDTMVLRLGLARILLTEKQDAVALAHLETVLADVEHHRLDTWDPLFALDALTVIFKAFNKLTDPRYKDRARDVMMRIASISTVDAITL